MRLARTFFVTSVCFATGVLAQAPNPYNGTWRAEFETKKGADMQGTIVIKDQGGSWDMLSKSGSNPCLGRAYQIAVQQATTEALVFEISRSKALAGCKDGTATLNRIDDKTLEGEFDHGRRIKLIRQ